MTKPSKHRMLTGMFFLLVALMPFLSGGYYLLKENQIRHEMKERLEQKVPGHTLVLETSKIIWIKKGKEIFVNGHYFDIRSIKEKDGWSEVEGLYDTEETIFKKQFAGAWSRQSEKNIGFVTLSVFSLSMFEELRTESSISFEFVPKLFATYPSHIIERSPEIQTPPPERA